MAKEISKEQMALYNSIKNDVKKANQRLVRLERTYGQDSWASKRLASRLDTEKVQAFTNQGRIRLNQSMSINQMLAIKKATEQFLSSKTSTLSGIKKIIPEQKKGIEKLLADGKEVDEKDIETVYEMLSDEDFNNLKDKIRYDALVDLMINAKELKQTQAQFRQQVEQYIIEGNDMDFVARLERLYDKFIK